MNDIIEFEEKIIQNVFFGENPKNTSEVKERTVITEYNDGTSTQETYTKGAWYRNIKYPNGITVTNCIVFPNADKQTLTKRLASPTQQDIANILGISQPTVSRILNGCDEDFDPEK